MVEKTTGAMQEFGTPVAPGRGAMAGLVLLYTEEYPALPPAFMLDRPRLVVGRDETADLPLPVGAVSRIHAELSWERSSWVIRDLGSRNGTLVDGRPVSAVELEPGNEIRIGDAIFKFVDKHAELYSSFRIDGALVAGARGGVRAPTHWSAAIRWIASAPTSCASPPRPSA